MFLSGGLDSSLIAALAARAAPELTAFTVRIDNDSFDETPHADAVARHLGLRHEVVTLGEADLLRAFDAISDKLAEPLGDSSLLPTWLVCWAARQLMTVALGGDGADELFAGYPNFGVQRFAPAMRLIPPAWGRLAGQAIGRLRPGTSYMNWRFLAAQLVQGLGAATERQSFFMDGTVRTASYGRVMAPGSLAAKCARCRLRSRRSTRCRGRDAARP